MLKLFVTILGFFSLAAGISSCDTMNSMVRGTPQQQVDKAITTINKAPTAAINPYLAYNYQDVQMVYGQQVIFHGFVSDEAITELSCMGFDSIKPPSTPRRPKTTYNQAMRDAFIDNLTKIGSYSEAAPIILRVEINDVDVDSISGTWDFDLTFNSSNGTSARFERSYAFTAGMDLTVCSTAAANFRPALEQYVFDVITSQDFAILSR